jgi:hypothetical protein
MQFLTEFAQLSNAATELAQPVPDFAVTRQQGCASDLFENLNSLFGPKLSCAALAGFASCCVTC